MEQKGLAEIKGKIGLTIAQDEKSCVVFGMPKTAIERRYVQNIVSLEDMAPYLINALMGKEVNYGTSVH